MNALMTELRRRIDRRCVTLLHGCLATQGRQADAEDLYQEFLIALPRLVHKLNGDHDGAAWKWMQVVLLNLARDHLRRGRREQLTSDGETPEPETAPANDNSDDGARDESRWAALLNERGWAAFVEEVVSAERVDYREGARRNLSMVRDHHCGGLDVPALARKYFGADDKPARNKVSAYMKRAREDLMRAWQRMQARPEEALP